MCLPPFVLVHFVRHINTFLCLFSVCLCPLCFPFFFLVLSFLLLNLFGKLFHKGEKRVSAGSRVGVYARGFARFQTLCKLDQMLHLIGAFPLFFSEDFQLFYKILASFDMHLLRHILLSRLHILRGCGGSGGVRHIRFITDDSAQYQ